MPAPAFLDSLIPQDASAPHITLTYAQSLDARIAGPGRQQIQLSGKESMLMTHWLRSMHEGIMVGVGTAINDDPRLNVRLLPSTVHHKTPRPIILDPNLRLPATAKMFKTLRDPETPHAKAPWILCRDDGDAQFAERRLALEVAGGRVVPVAMVDGRLDLTTLSRLLRELGINTLMVEGGAQIIEQFLSTSLAERPLVDSLVITVAPMLVPNGVGISARKSTGEFEHCHTEVMGRDAVMVLRGRIPGKENV